MTQADDLAAGAHGRAFAYGEEETDYLRSRDARMAEVIERIGHVSRMVDDDLFTSVVRSIVGQQISTKAHATIWRRLVEGLGAVDAAHVAAASAEQLQSYGISFRKASYIHDFANKVLCGEFDLDAVTRMSDDEAIAALTSLKGVGTWTAEMILLFCFERPNVFSYDDLGIQRGLRMVYHHRAITPKLFEKYRRRFSPYCSVASLYLWEVAGGAIPEMRDFAPKRKRNGRAATGKRGGNASA